MSYEKIKTIKIKDNKVFINCASNNCRPLTYYNETYPYYNKILNEEGEEAVNIALLKSYEEGSFQDGINKYTKALKVLRYVYAEEYKKFNWRNHNAKYDSEEYNKERDLRNSEEFKELLRKCLNYKFPKDKFVITKIHTSYNYQGEVYAKVCTTCVKWSKEKDKATKFNFKEEAEDHIFESYKNQWRVEKLEGGLKNENI